MTLSIVLALCAAVGLWLVPAAPRTHGGVEGNFAHRSRLGKRIRAGRWRGKQNLHRDEAAIVGAALTSVAARLRAGQSPRAAWYEVAKSLPEPFSIDIQELGNGAGSAHRTGRMGPALNAADAATRLAQELGAELAPVLEACSEGIEESTRARAERNAAFAGPRATARLLLALPVAGVGLGSLMGAGPVVLFTSSIWGALLAVAAAFLLLVGRWWIRRLLQRASTAGEGAT